MGFYFSNWVFGWDSIQKIPQKSGLLYQKMGFFSRKPPRRGFIEKGWGCNQEWGCKRVYGVTIITLHTPRGCSYVMISWTLHCGYPKCILYIILCFLWYVNFFIQFFFSRYAGPHFTKIPLLKTPTRLELNGSLDLSRPESINQQIPNMSCKSSTIKPKNNLKVKPKAPMSKEEIKAQQLVKAMGKHRKRIYVISGSEALFAS